MTSWLNPPIILNTLAEKEKQWSCIKYHIANSVRSDIFYCETFLYRKKEMKYDKFYILTLINGKKCLVKKDTNRFYKKEDINENEFFAIKKTGYNPQYIGSADFLTFELFVNADFSWEYTENFEITHEIYNININIKDIFDFSKAPKKYQDLPIPDELKPGWKYNEHTKLYHFITNVFDVDDDSFKGFKDDIVKDTCFKYYKLKYKKLDNNSFICLDDNYSIKPRDIDDIFGDALFFEDIQILTDCPKYAELDFKRRYTHVSDYYKIEYTSYDPTYDITCYPPINDIENIKKYFEQNNYFLYVFCNHEKTDYLVFTQNEIVENIINKEKINEAIKNTENKILILNRPLTTRSYLYNFIEECIGIIEQTPGNENESDITDDNCDERHWKEWFVDENNIDKYKDKFKKWNIRIEQGGRIIIYYVCKDKRFKKDYRTDIVILLTGENKPDQTFIIKTDGTIIDETNHERIIQNHNYEYVSTIMDKYKRENITIAENHVEGGKRIRKRNRKTMKRKAKGKGNKKTKKGDKKTKKKTKKIIYKNYSRV